MTIVKKFGTAALLALTFTVNVSAVELFVDTKKIETDTPPVIVEGRTLVPVRAIFEALGATVDWDGETRTAYGTRADVSVTIPIDSTVAYINGEERRLDVPAQIINDRTMVPARFVAEALECNVSWNEETGTAAVADILKSQPIYVTKTGKRYHFSNTCNGGTYYAASLAEAMGRELTPCDKCILTEEFLADHPEMEILYSTYR